MAQAGDAACILLRAMGAGRRGGPRRGAAGIEPLGSHRLTNEDVLAFIEEANEINRMLVAAARGAIAREDKDNLLRYLKAHAGRLQALERHVEGMPEEESSDPSRPDPAATLPPPPGG